MLATLVFRSLLKNARISTWTLATLATCAALVTLFTTALLEVGEKMSSTLRRMGANAVAYPAATPVDWAKFESVAQSQRADALRLCVRVGTIEGRAVAVVAGDLQNLQRLTPYWIVTGQRAASPTECVVGKRAADALHLKVGQEAKVERSNGGARATYRVVGIAETGDEDEDRVFVAAFPSDGRESGFTYALLSVAGGEPEIARLQQALAAQRAGIDIKPLRQVIQGEQHVLAKVSLLSVATLCAVLALTSLGVSASMLARVVERRKEFALLQALGATKRAVVQFLLAESATIGATASVVGFCLGTVLSEVVVRQIFNVSIAPHWLAFVMALGITSIVSLLAGGIACARTLRFETAAALKGD